MHFADHDGRAKPVGSALVHVGTRSYDASGSRKNGCAVDVNGTRNSGDAGYGLVEILISVLLLGLLVVGVMSLLGTMAIAANDADTQSRAEQYAIEAAEAARAAGMLDVCADVNNAPVDYKTAIDAAVSEPDKIAEITVEAVEYHVPGTLPASDTDWLALPGTSFPAGTPDKYECTDITAHRVTVKAESANGRTSATRRVVVR